MIAPGEYLLDSRKLHTYNTSECRFSITLILPGGAAYSDFCYEKKEFNIF
jgi:hypothetical protein